MKWLAVSLVPILILLCLVSYIFFQKTTVVVPVPVNIVHSVQFASSTLGISFKHPSNYFAETKDFSLPDRKQITVSFTQDTEANRGVDHGSIFKGTEGPVRIYVNVYQNDKKHQKAADWIKNNVNSNFKLSDGAQSKIFVDGKPGIQYKWSGLYEADNIVVSTDKFLYSFVVTYIAPDDQIRSDFTDLINTITFTQ